jgi:hypothetical protein
VGLEEYRPPEGSAGVAQVKAQLPFRGPRHRLRCNPSPRSTLGRQSLRWQATQRRCRTGPSVGDGYRPTPLPSRPCRPSGPPASPPPHSWARPTSAITDESRASPGSRNDMNRHPGPHSLAEELMDRYSAAPPTRHSNRMCQWSSMWSVGTTSSEFLRPALRPKSFHQLASVGASAVHRRMSEACSSA